MIRHNKAVLVGAFLIMVGAFAMAQDWKMDVYLGGRMGATKDFDPYDFGGNTNMKLKPNILLGYNAWVYEFTDTMAIGPIVRFGLSFPQKVGISYEAQDAYYKGANGFLPSAITKDLDLEGSTDPVLLSIDGLIGVGYKFEFIKNFSLAAKLGFAISYDSASMSWDNVMGGTTDFSAGYIMMGPGLDIAAQYVLPLSLSDKMDLYLELGVNLAYFLTGYSTFTIDAKAKEWVDEYVTNPDGSTSVVSVEKEVSKVKNEGQGASAPRSYLSMGLPYLAIGIRF